MHVQNSKTNTFWKIFLRIMLLIFVVTTAWNFFTWGYYEYTWSKFCKEQSEAQQAGYENPYYICNREENVTLNGTDYVHFRAYRSAFLDDCYKEELLIPSNLTYIDKVPTQKEGLVIFAKEVSSYKTKQGDYYTIVNIYSVCDYGLARSKRFMDIAVMATVTAVFVEIVMAILFLIHKIRQKAQ